MEWRRYSDYDAISENKERKYYENEKKTFSNIIPINKMRQLNFVTRFDHMTLYKLLDSFLHFCSHLKQLMG